MLSRALAALRFSAPGFFSFFRPRLPAPPSTSCSDLLRLMAAAAHAGVHGLDPWLESLRALIDAEPIPATLEDALAPLAALGGADVAAALRAVERQRRAPPGAWHPDDWRRTHPDNTLRLTPNFAVAIRFFLRLPLSSCAGEQRRT